MKRLLCVGFLCGSLAFAQDAAGAAKDKTDTALRAEIQELMKIMHVDTLMRQQLKSSMPPMIKMLKQNPSVTPEFADEFGKRFEAEIMSSNDLNDMIVDAYAQRFTLGEIKDLEVFYKSPTGKKMVELQPELMSEVSKKAGGYGQTLAMRVGQEIAAQHPEFVKSGGDKDATQTPPKQ
jgi:hypothetical protein